MLLNVSGKKQRHYQITNLLHVLISDIILTMFNLHATYQIYFQVIYIPAYHLDLKMMFNDEFGDIREVFINVTINMAKSENALRKMQQAPLKKNISLSGIQMEISWISA